MIVDETQLIRDKNRGPLLELLLTRIKRLKPVPQVILLSATVRDLGGFDLWLPAKLVKIENRPVPLWEGVIEKPEPITLHNIADRQTETREFNLPASLDDKEAILEALVKGLQPTEQMLIFRTQVDATEKTADRLAHNMAVQPISGDIRNRILLLEDSPMRSFLEKYTERRVAYHNAGLSVEERRLVEALFHEGVLQVIVTTATLAAGVNLPADIVVIADFQRYDPSIRTQVPIDAAEYKNCAGRAGRYGKRTAGTSLIITQQSGQTELLTKEYIYGKPPKLESAIPMRPELMQQVLGVIGGQLADTRPNVIGLFCDSFAFHTFYKPNNCEDEMVQAIESGIKKLIALGLVEEKGKKLEVTPLGEIAARSGVYIETFGVLKDLASNSSLETCDVYDIFIHITNVEEMRRLRPFSAEKRAEILTKWISGESVMKLATDYSTQYSVGNGHIRDLGNIAEWLLSTAALIGTAIKAKDVIIERLSKLAQEAHFGVPIQLVSLAELRALPRSDILRLLFNDKGVQLTDPHDIIDADPSLFVDILAPQKVIALKEKIAQSIGETLKRRKIGHLLRCDRLAAARPLVERVYDAQGTDFDRALEDLLNAPMVELGVHRFTRQPSGQPDLELQGIQGTIVISATASEDNQKPVSWNKSREVLGSVGYSGKASNFLVIGKPDFHKVAMENAQELAGKGENLLLVPVDVIVELCLQIIEGKIPQKDLISKLEDMRGILQRKDLDLLK